MADVRFFMTSASISTYEATPIWDTELEYRREKDQIFYREKIRREMTFRGLDYSYLTALDVDECEEITLAIQRKCSGSYSAFLTGTFNAGDWRDNQDDCEITVQVNIGDDYECLLSTWKTPVNLFTLTQVLVKPYSIVEKYVTDTEIDDVACNDCGVTPLDPVDPDNWCAEYESNNCIHNPGCMTVTTWHRVEGTGTCSGGTPVAPTPDSYWTLLTDNCPTDSTWWRCPGDAVNHTNAPMPYGRLFSDVVERIFEGCGLTVISDFFNINGDATNPSNDAYDFAADYLQNMTVHQKSDVKRPYATDPSTSRMWDITPQKFLNDMRIMFNVYWEISGTDLRLEHISYFETTGGLDCTGDAQKLDTQRQDDDNVKKEFFYFVDEAASTYFKGYPIDYDCGAEVKENRCQVFSTDVTEIQNTNSEAFADKDFVLCSTEVISTVHYLIRDNRPLSFTELHDALHRHYRYWKNGTLNNIATTFTTYRPTRTQPRFDHVLCCDDTFNPREPVTTGIGVGYVESAVYNVHNDILSLDVKH